jgi:hypothetical protein
MTPAGFDYSGVDVIYACAAVLIYQLSIKRLESWEKGSPGSRKPTARLQMGGLLRFHSPSLQGGRKHGRGIRLPHLLTPTLL